VIAQKAKTTISPKRRALSDLIDESAAHFSKGAVPASGRALPQMQTSVAISTSTSRCPSRASPEGLIMNGGGTPESAMKLFRKSAEPKGMRSHNVQAAWFINRDAAKNFSCVDSVKVSLTFVTAS